MSDALQPLQPPHAMPARDQVWVPLDDMSAARTIMRVTTLRTGAVWVCWSLPMHCPCCQTLLRTESDSTGSEPLEDWLSWVVTRRATQAPASPGP